MSRDFTTEQRPAKKVPEQQKRSNKHKYDDETSLKGRHFVVERY
jgi:hypothetical protein